MRKIKRERRTYFTLAVLNNGKWGVEFGDWDIQFVKEEMKDLRDKGRKERDMMIVRSDGMQSSIDAAIAILNSGNVA